MPPRRQRSPSGRIPPPAPAAAPAAAAGAAAGTAAGRSRSKARSPGFLKGPTVRTGAQLARGSPAHVVMAEFLVAVAVIVLRTVGQYEPRSGGTARGVIKPSKPGALGPLPMLAATLIVYFILAVLAVSGGARARVAAVAGLAYDLAMLLNSTAELNKLSLHLKDVGTGKSSPGGGPGPGSSAYQSVLSGGSGSGSGGYTVKPGPGNTCPSGYTYDGNLKLCVINPVT